MWSTLLKQPYKTLQTMWLFAEMQMCHYVSCVGTGFLFRHCGGYWPLCYVKHFNEEKHIDEPHYIFFCRSHPGELLPCFGSKLHISAMQNKWCMHTVWKLILFWSMKSWMTNHFIILWFKYIHTHKYISISIILFLLLFLFFLKKQLSRFCKI